MDGRVALVTGANKGIGLEIARGLGALGITVLVGARDGSRGRDAVAVLRQGGADAHHLALDVTDEVSVSGAARRVEADFGRLDILVNNAGVSIGSGRRPSEVAPADVRRTYEVNVFGVVTVTNAFLPLLRRAPAARIVNMSSSLGSLARNADPGSGQGAVNLLAYNSSKAALNAVTLEYAKELRGTPIKINAACPGYCATDLNGRRGHRTATQGAVIAVRLATLPDDGPSGAYLDEDGTVPW